jgi:hypothetical protein
MKQLGGANQRLERARMDFAQHGSPQRVVAIGADAAALEASGIGRPRLLGIILH